MSDATPIAHENLGKGIDQFHPENRIPDGYWEDLLNCDPLPDGSISKRRGYQRYAGYVPIRVISVQHSGTNIDFTVDSSLDLTSLRSTPIVVYGRLSSSQSGDFSTTDVAKYYSSFTISSGKIRVTDAGAVSATYTDTAPQLTVWGIDWSADILADDAAARAAWVNHLDTYVSTLESRPVCGLGGNLFAARTQAEVGTSHKLGKIYPLLRGTRTGSNVTIGPALWASAESPTRTRGYIKASTVTGGYAVCPAAAYNAGTGYVDFTLTMTGISASGTLADIITAGKDRLTVRALQSELNGTWVIRGVTQGADTLTVSCDVAGATEKWDVSGHAGQAGIFTDLIPLTSSSKFDDGDLLTSATISSDDDITAWGSSGSDILAAGVTEQMTLPLSEVIYGTRTSAVLVGRASGGTASISDLVRGDVLTVVGYTRRVRVVNVNPSSDRTVSVTGDGATATATITAGDSTANLAVGDRLRLRGAGDYSGDIEVTAINSTTEFEFASTSTESVTGATVVGLTAGLDEAIELADSSAGTTYVEVHARWIPIEWSSSLSSTSKTKVRHFDLEDADTQELVRSCMAGDSMYFTDGVHDVMKFDGTSLTRAGLFRWQPTLFAAIRPISTGIAHPRAPLQYTSLEGNTAVVDSGDEKSFSPGERVSVVPGTLGETVETSVLDTSIDTKIKMAGSLDAPVGAPASGGGGTSYIHRSVTLKYYARLNAIDANGRIIASAACQSNDLTVRFGPRSQVELTLQRPPLLGLMDITRIEVQLYRTGGYEGTPPFFLIYTGSLSYANYAAEIRLIDNTPPELLMDESGASIGELDPAHSVLVGDELGTAWTCPPRAKYIAGAAGRLVLANLRSYPQIDLVMRRPADTSSVTGNRLVGQKVLLRRSSNSETVTDNDDVFVFEYVGDSRQTEIGPAAPFQRMECGTDGESFTIEISSASGASLSGIAAGDWIYLTAVTGRTFVNSLVSGYGGWWQIRSVASNRLTIKKAGEYTRRTISGINTTTEIVTTSTAHGLRTGDPVFISGASGATLPTGPSTGQTYYAEVVSSTELKFHYTYEDAVTGSTDLDFTAAGSGTLYLNKGDIGAFPRYLFTATDFSDVPVLIEDNFDYPFFYDHNYDVLGGHAVDHQKDPCELVAARRLADAINSTQVKVDPGLYASFTPFAVANAGNDFGPAQVVIESPFASAEVPTLQHTITALSVYANGSSLAAGTEVTAEVRRFPSRLVRSYKNFPEIFDAPYAQIDNESDSAIDVAPDDGQEITGIIPFYGESNFAQSAKEAIVLVAKTSSFYVVNVDTKQVQFIETAEQGCEYPRSLAPTKYGIMFANRSGMWKINRSMEVVYLGKFVKRLWDEYLDGAAEYELPVAAHHARDHRYALSLPSVDGDGVSNDAALTYDHTQETNPSGVDPDGGLGAWNRYEYAHKPLSWTTRGEEVMFGTTLGTVHALRRAGDNSDFRDDDQPITARATYGARSFGTAAARKVLEGVVVSYRVASDVVGMVVRAATGLVASWRDLDNWEPLDEVELEASDEDEGDGDALGDVERPRVRSVMYTVQDRRAVYHQVQIENAELDEPLVVTQLDFLVSPLPSGRGLEKAGSTAARNRAR